MKFSIPFRPNVAASSIAFCSSIFGKLINSTAIFAFSSLTHNAMQTEDQENKLSETLKRKTKI